MSQENVEAFTRGIDAYNRGDLEALVAVHDAEVEWHPILELLLGGEETVYRGHDGVREFISNLDEAFDFVHIEVLEVRDLGDRLFATSRWRVRGRASGAGTEMPLAFVLKFRDGKVIWARTFDDRDRALEAAGLRE